MNSILFKKDKIFALPGRRWLLTAVWILLAWLPALVTGSLMNRFAVNIPVWDDFERAELLERYHSGTLDFDYLISPHIEHRILLPRLVILINAVLLDGEIRAEVWLNFLAMLTSSVFLAALLWKTRPGRPSNWLVIFLFNLCIFSLMQYQNLCWAIQIAFFWPLTFLTGVLLVLRSDLRLPWKFGLCLAGALGGAFCFSHGLVIWAVVFAWFLLTGEKWSPLRRGLAAGAWAAVAAVVIFLYFQNMATTSHPGHSYSQQAGEKSPGLAAILDGEVKAERVKEVFLLAMGSHYCRYVFFLPRKLAPPVATGMLALFGVLAAGAIADALRRRSGERWNNYLPWLALGTCILVSMLLVAMGRANFAPLRALSPRYLTISLYFSVALVALLVLVAPAWLGGSGRRLPSQAGFFVAGLFVMLQGWNWLYGYRAFQIWNAARCQSLVSFVFPNFSDTEHSVRLDFNPYYAREQAGRMKVQGYDHLPEPLDRDDFSRFGVSQKVLSGLAGGVTAVKDLEEPGVEGWRIEGFANIAHILGRPVDAVLFTVGPPEDREIVGFAESTHEVPSHFVAQDYEFSSLALPDPKEQTKWSGRLLRKNLPAPGEMAVEVTAWALNLPDYRAYQIADTIRLE